MILANFRRLHLPQRGCQHPNKIEYQEDEFQQTFLDVRDMAEKMIKWNCTCWQYVLLDYKRITETEYQEYLKNRVSQKAKDYLDGLNKAAAG